MGFIGDIFGGDYGLRIFLDERLLEALLGFLSCLGLVIRGSAPIVPRGSAFRICLFHRQIHGSRRRAGARVRG